MKQRFSSLDVKVIAHELSTSLVSLRVSNIYDLSSKILLLKFAKPEVKKQLLIDSGFRCHLTDFERTTAPAPSVFVQKLRKTLKTRRVTAVSQIGTDRILEFQFSDGQYRLYLEFFAGGNVILTDGELKILTLLRNVPEGEGQEPQRQGLAYSLDNRQNYGGVPPLTKERVRDALQTTIQKAATSAAAGKKIKKKPGDELRRGLATTILEFPPILVDHAMKVTGFDSSVSPSTVLEHEELLDNLLKSLAEAQRIIQEVTSTDKSKGYILAKTRPGADFVPAEGDQPEKRNLLYEDFHPFLPRQFEEDPAYTVLSFDSFNKMVDEFFSSVEGQKLVSKLNEKEAAAKRKLDATKADHAKRIEGLQAVQTLNIRKANAIEANVERVQEAIDAVNGLIQQGMDWEDIGKLVDRERRRNNPVASIIVPPLKLEENTITVLLGEAEEEEDDDDDASDTDSVSSDDSGYAGTEASARKARENRLKVDINLDLSPYANAREYYGERKIAAVKEQKTVLQSENALKNAEQKIAAELKKGLKQEKPVLHPIRKQSWFEKFIWFISSDGYLVLGGKDAQQNEMLYRRYLKKGDVYVHADLHGAPSVVIKNTPSTPDAPIPPSTLSQAGSLAVCASSAWDSKAGMGAWWVNADQVSKSAPTGEFLGTGSFMVRGKKNFLPPAQLLLGLGLMFKISEESKAKHVKHRLYDLPESLSGGQASTANTGKAPDNAGEGTSADHDESDSEDSAIDVEEDADPKENPLQSTDQYEDEDESPDPIQENPLIQGTEDFARSGEPSTSAVPGSASHIQDNESDDEQNDNTEVATEADYTAVTKANSPVPGSSGKSTPQPQKKGQQPKRGQRGKAKKIASKYKDQDDEDRAAIEALIGATAGKQKAEAEAKVKAEREAQKAATLERRRAQHQRQQRETAEHEEVRKMMLEEGIETLDIEEAASLTPLDALVGTPLPGDETLEVIALCAPYSALGKCKYKVKMQPGAQKKGKAVKEILEAWKMASTKKGVVDEKSLDKEKMWPREVELFKALKPEEVINVVPVGKLRVMLSGAGGGGGDAKGKGGNKGSANRGKKK
ncbi:fibronectin-binding protein A N-terminus-domain-containing protein [Hypoxylon trugodes]|uniref:fibronectin-binding protein A N-terminus-domain-containing protein n=1 Tax=Hypoxylon trugodes TaxID=326681 RepID=UPI0021933B5C|nr:fibronectin-binding protein A N-terminus-domain-containing protein [Hypoxylon trugodes]KAI1392324.1 fibronectin-binding protein A N-terminus-domain-containing protein [Hypoxylon trugodes]